MTPEQFAAARRALGLSTYELGEALGLAGSREVVGKRVRQMEAGGWTITGPIARLMGALADGWRPGTLADTDSRAVRRMLATVDSLLLESGSAKAKAEAMQRRGDLTTAMVEAAAAEAFARAGNRMARTLQEIML